MVLPAELLHIPHAGSLRQFLLSECSRLLILDPADLWFDDTLQGVVLLLAEKRVATKKNTADVAILPLRNRAALEPGADQLFRRADFFSGSVLNGKWMLGLLSGAERQLIEKLEKHPQVRRFVDVAAVDVGIVTGANHFFLVNDDVVQEYGLQDWAYPMFGRSAHVQGVIYDRRRHADNCREGLPANFLWFGATPLDEFPTGVRQYLEMGEAQGLHTRYKCRIRTPWYAVPSVHAAPVAMLKRCHHFPRLVLNRAGAFTTDTAYRIQPRGVSASGLVASFVNSLTALSSELEGRHYGGGVQELVPSEIERLLIPLGQRPTASLSDLDKLVRSGMPAEEVLATQDKTLLRPLGVSAAEAEAVLNAWTKLRNRRQRNGREATETESKDD